MSIVKKFTDLTHNCYSYEYCTSSNPSPVYNKFCRHHYPRKQSLLSAHVTCDPSLGINISVVIRAPSGPPVPLWPLSSHHHLQPSHPSCHHSSSSHNTLSTQPSSNPSVLIPPIFPFPTTRLVLTYSTAVHNSTHP